MRNLVAPARYQDRIDPFFDLSTSPPKGRREAAFLLSKREGRLKVCSAAVRSHTRMVPPVRRGSQRRRETATVQFPITIRHPIAPSACSFLGRSALRRRQRSFQLPLQSEHEVTIRKASQRCVACRMARTYSISFSQATTLRSGRQCSSSTNTVGSIPPKHLTTQIQT